MFIRAPSVATLSSHLNSIRLWRPGTVAEHTAGFLVVVVDAAFEIIQPSHDEADLEFGLEVDVVIDLGGDAVFAGGAVLGHHDDRRGIRSLEGEGEVQKDEGVFIPKEPFVIGMIGVVQAGDGVPDDPDRQKRALIDDEFPTAHHGGKTVAQPLAESHLPVFDLVDVLADGFSE